MSRSADALRRRKVRGMDLWVEMEEMHGSQPQKSARRRWVRGWNSCWRRCPSRSGRRWFFATRRT